MLMVSSVAFGQQSTTVNADQANHDKLMELQKELSPEAILKLQQLGLLETGSKSEEFDTYNPATYLGTSNPISKPLSTAVYDPKNYPAPSDQGGDDIGTAVVLTGPLPITSTGTTTGYTNDYDEICPYSGSTAPDVVYAYTPGADVIVDISLCNDLTDYDTKLYVYDIPNPVTGDAIACNDDACSTPLSDYVSEILGVQMFGGTTYYIVIDGYSSANGFYDLSIIEYIPPLPCVWGVDIVAPPGAIPETEPCGDDLNGACNMAAGTETWEPVPGGGGTVSGTMWADAGNRDTDWFELVLTESATVVLTADADQLIGYGLIDGGTGGYGGAPDCLTVTGIDPFTTAGPCDETSIDFGLMDVGTYWFFVGMQVYEGFPCDNHYYITFEITPVTTFEVTGMVNYSNAGSTPIDLSPVTIYDAGMTVFGVTETDASGDYGLTGLPNGDFSVGPMTYKPRGGTNILDAINTRQYLGGTYPMSTLQQAAANVNGSPAVDILDAIFIQMSLSGPEPPGWIAPDWVWDDGAFTVAGANEVVNLNGLCSGDPNGSYIPPAGLFFAPGTNCAFPYMLTGVPYTATGMTTCGFVDDYDDIACGSSYMGGEDFVYEYTPASDITVDIVLTNTDSWTGLFVTDGCPDVGTCVDFATNSGGNPALYGVSLLGGTTYNIIVSTWPPPDCTPFDISITEAAGGPANDNFCDPQAIVVDDPAIVGDNTASTIEGWELAGSCWFTSASNSVWYSFVAPPSGAVQVNTDFVTGNDDTELTLYDWTGGTCDSPTLTEMGCGEDDGVTGFGYMAIIDATGLTPGATYYVQLDGYDSTMGDFLIEVTAQ